MMTGGQQADRQGIPAVLWRRGTSWLAGRWRRRPKLSGGLVARLLGFNVLLVFLPAAGILYLDTYEQKLLDAQERGMVQQGRVLAAALASESGLDTERARAILAQVEQRFTARLRVIDQNGRLVADSTSFGPGRPGTPQPVGPLVPATSATASAGGPNEALSAEPPASPGEEVTRVVPNTPTPTVAPTSTPSELSTNPRSNLLYRFGAFVVRTAQRGLARLGLAELPSSAAGREHYSPEEPFDGSEVRAALAGRYGAATRPSPGQRSLTLYSAIPIRTIGAVGPPIGEGRVVGAVLISQSTLRLLADLYETRLAIVRVVVASLLVAGVLSLMVSTTIVRPLAELRRQAAELLDRRGRLRGRFQGNARRDEIGDLARALEELSRRVGEHITFIESFAADVSHEFKNPLAAIRSATQMLAEVETADERRRFQLIVEREVARMERLLSGVREVSELDSALEGEARSPVALRELLAGVVAGWQARHSRDQQLANATTAAATVGVELVAVPELAGLRVLAGADRLVQVFDNLLDNALSFSPSGSTVGVTLELDPPGGVPHAGSGANTGTSGPPADGVAVVEIRDLGPGIPPEHLDRVFDRFFTWRPGQPQSKSHHSGLGLAIVKAIVEGYGGSVVARNRPGGGASFVVRLPVLSG